MDELTCYTVYQGFHWTKAYCQFMIWVMLCRQLDSYSGTTDIQGRSQTLYTASCNGGISHGAQIGGLRVFQQPCKNKRKTNVSTIFARRSAVYSCLSSRSAGVKILFRATRAILSKISQKNAPVVHFSIDWYLLTRAVLWKVGANRPYPWSILSSDAQTAVDAGGICTWIRLFWSQEKSEDPQFEPHARMKMAQVLRCPLYTVKDNYSIWSKKGIAL